MSVRSETFEIPSCGYIKFESSQNGDGSLIVPPESANSLQNINPFAKLFEDYQQRRIVQSERTPWSLNEAFRAQIHSRISEQSQQEHQEAIVHVQQDNLINLQEEEKEISPRAANR